MAAGDVLDLTLPSVGAAGTTFATQINTALTAIEASFEEAVPIANIDFSVDLETNAFRLLNLGAATFTSKTATLASSYTNHVYVVGGDLYYNNSSGVAVQITDGPGLDITAAAGIGGDYGTGLESFEYDTSDEAYKAFGNAVDYADVWARGFRLFELTGGGDSIRVLAPNSVTSYTLTLPAAAPASTSALVMASTGTVTASRDLTLASVTMDSGGSVTVSGTGRYKHGAIAKQYSPFALVDSPAGGTAIVHSISGFYTSFPGATSAAILPLDVEVGTTIGTIAVSAYSPAGTGDLTCELYSVIGDAAGGPTGAIEATGTLSNLSANSAATYVAITAANETVLATASYFLYFSRSADSDVRLTGISVSISQA